MTRKHVRFAAVALLAFYGIVCLRSPGAGRLLDGVDLAIHESGHLVFSPLGEVLTVVGGTLFQLIIPATFVVYFWRRKDRFAAAFPLWWVAQNLWNISVYVADARAEQLPLVGGGEHDWAYLLGRAGWLARDVALGQAVHATGVATFFVAILVAAANATPKLDAGTAEEIRLPASDSAARSLTG